MSSDNGAVTPTTQTSPNESGDDDIKRKLIKMQKETYRSEKKRVTQELCSALKDPTVVVMADWLKIRGTLRKWSRFYCVLKPGLLLIYKSPKTHKHGYWVGTVLLNCCELVERPSKKDGFCLKLFHPLDQFIWATRGPKGEVLGAVTQPLPSSYLICRAASQEAGICWMDALQLSLRCSGLLMRTMSKLQDGGGGSSSNGGGVKTSVSATGGSWVASTTTGSIGGNSTVQLRPTSGSITSRASAIEDHADDLIGKWADVSADVSGVVPTELNESDAERHFAEAGLGDEDEHDSDSESGLPDETKYIQSPPEVFGALGDAEQTEDFADENKSLIWALMKQVRPGMDLSKVTLPTFILEPRSFLEKLTDFYYHADLVKEAIEENDPFLRMKNVVKFYLSGFYKKPKGLKKPYNPILGEVFRCYWQHDDAEKSKTFYLAEQVSHHPPVSAFYVSNRQAGFNVNGTIFAKSKFYGNSLSALMNGQARMTLLSRGETYTVTLPYAHCKGLLVGTLSMELAGQVTIVCDKTSYSAELEFKLKPFLGGGDLNAIAGKIKLGRETLADISGHWDGEIYFKNRQSAGDVAKELLWAPTTEAIKRRVQRYQVPVEEQLDNESQKLWSQVSIAIDNADQSAATDEKTVLEEAQRKRARQLKESGDTHTPVFFELEPSTGLYIYKHSDYRPWDPQNDLYQYESACVIRTRSKHRTPIVRSASVGSVHEEADDEEHSDDDDDTLPFPKPPRKRTRGVTVDRAALDEALKPIANQLQTTSEQLGTVLRRVELMSSRGRRASEDEGRSFLPRIEGFWPIALLLLFHAIVLGYLLKR